MEREGGASMHDVVVIGAGMAGGTAGRDCTRAGFRVLLVEGQDAIGGRVFTNRERWIVGLREDRIFDLEHGTDWRLCAGYDALPRWIADGLDVRVGWTVADVRWGADGVTVTATDGEELRARSAVCTLPVGVLKCG